VLMFKHIYQASRAFVKALFRMLGLDVVRLKYDPRETLAGLQHCPVQTVIDCGANRGQFARYISRFFPNATLYCFEPLEEPFQSLSAWAASQNNRVRCFNVALGDREGIAVMHHHVEHSPSSSLLPTTEYEERMFSQTVKQADITVPLTTLDAALSDVLDSIEPEIILKLDVQGYEDRVLRGAECLIRKVHACILEVSIDPMYTSQAVFKDLVLFMDAHGLVYAGNLDQSCGEDGRVMWLDALFVRR